MSAVTRSQPGEARLVPRTLKEADDARRSGIRGTKRDKALLPPEAKQERLVWPLKLFLIGLMVPWAIPIGPLALSVYRIVLLIAVIPCLLAWLRGRAGPKRLADFGFLLFCSWAAIAFFVVQGVEESIEPAGILFIETMGAYMLARVCIRTPQDFSRMVLFVAKAIVCMMPFAIYEWLTGTNLILLMFGTVYKTETIVVMPPRMGLWRVQGPFSHTILFGTFCGSMLALAGMATIGRLSPKARAILAGLVGFTALLSMSSAPIGGLLFQLILLMWNKALGGFAGRWKLLWAIVFAGYLLIEFGSNQTPVQFYISHFTFEQQTGWYRIWIFDYGSASVANHPLFGIGLGDWERPVWMPESSVDNFWLLMAMRHGLPAFLLMTLSWLHIWFSVAKHKSLDPTVDACRIAYLICMATFVFVGSTVHFWGAVYAWFFFLGGSGVWILDSTRLTLSSKYRRFQGRDLDEASDPTQTRRGISVQGAPDIQPGGAWVKCDRTPIALEPGDKIQKSVPSQ